MQIKFGTQAEAVFQGCAQDSFLVWTQNLASALSDSKIILHLKL